MTWAHPLTKTTEVGDGKHLRGYCSKLKTIKKRLINCIFIRIKR